MMSRIKHHVVDNLRERIKLAMDSKRPIRTSEYLPKSRLYRFGREGIGVLLNAYPEGTCINVGSCVQLPLFDGANRVEVQGDHRVYSWEDKYDSRIADVRVAHAGGGTHDYWRVMDITLHLRQYGHNGVVKQLDSLVLVPK